MAKEELSENPETVACKKANGKKIAFEVEIPESSDLVACQVCGHKNRIDAGMCEMCSNYLFD